MAGIGKRQPLPPDGSNALCNAITLFMIYQVGMYRTQPSRGIGLDCMTLRIVHAASAPVVAIGLERAQCNLADTGGHLVELPPFALAFF